MESCGQAAYLPGPVAVEPSDNPSVDGEIVHPIAFSQQVRDIFNSDHWSSGDTMLGHGWQSDISVV